MAADEKWYFTKEQLANTPSRKCGIDADKELSYRQQAANFIQDMGQRLAVSQLCINTAIVYMHRFYVFHSLSQFHRNAIAAAALFLAAKVEEQPRKLEHVIKVAYMCLHRDPNQTPPDTKSEQYLEQAQDLVFNENVLLQTLGFDVAIDHPHTHVVRCCQLVKASKDLAQTSYFMASNSLHLTTMCLQYKPTVVACFCIHLACKWSNWEIPQSNEGKHWFWYVDRSVTSELLQQLTAEFLHIFDKCPSRLKRKIMSISANQSPSINHPSLPNSPFDAEPRKVQSPAMTSDGGPTFQSSRPFHSEKQEDKKQTASVSGRPPVDFREYREKKERERIEREKAVASTAATVQGHVTDSNKHHSHHHKPVSGVAVPNKHPAPSGQKTALHHNHHHRPEVKVGQPVPQRHSSNSQPRDPNRDPNRQRLPREYNSNSGTSGGTMFSHGHPTHPSKDAPVDNSLADSSVNRSDSGISQESISHNNPQEKLSNNNHSIHRLSAADCKHQPHDKRAYDPRHKPSLEHRKDGEQKPYAKYPDPLRLERQRKPDTLEQRSEEVRKLIEKPLPVPKPRSEVQKEEYIANMLKQSLHSKYNQQDKPQGNPVVVLNEIKMASVGQNTLFTQEKSPNAPVSAATQMSQKLPIPKPVSNQHSVHGVSLILKDTVKNGNSQSSLNNVEDPKAEKRPRHEDLDRSSSSLQHNSLQTPPAKHRSLFSPEKTPTARESSHPQRSKSKQKTPPAAAKVPKQQERLPDPLMNLNLVSPFASPPPGVPQQNPSPPKRVANDVTTTSHKRHRTSSNSETEQPVKVKTEDMSNFEAMMLGRVPELIQPIRDSLTSTNGRGTSVANDLKPPELIRPFEPEPVVTQINMMSQQQISVTHQQPLLNGMDLNMAKQESHETRVKHDNLKSDVPGVEYTPIKLEYLSPMKSAQSISALLQEPLASMPSLLQGMQQFSQIVQQQVHQEQSQQQQLSQSLLLHDQQLSMQTQCSSLPVIGEANVVSTVDISALNTPVQGATEMTTGPITVSVPTLILPAEEKKLEHHKSEKKKKKEKHKHKDKDKSKEKRKHKHKDKEKQREKDKTEESVGSAVPIRITIPKDKLNLSTEQAAHTAIAVPPSLPISGKNKSPQGTGLKIKIPKERLKGTDGVSSSPAQPVIQAPLKITIRTDAISRSGGAAVGDFLTENRKRERDQNSSPTTSGPPSKKHTQSSNYTQQRPAERQNGRHYNSSSNNKEKHTTSHHKTLNKLSQSQQSHAT